MSSYEKLSYGDLHVKADEGDVNAAYYLGRILEKGIQGKKVNIPEALKWYAIAGAKGVFMAQYKLAALNQESKNFSEAAKWYEMLVQNAQANKPEHAEYKKAALYSLGIFYEAGQGVSADWRKAFSNFYMAAEMKHAKAYFNAGVLAFAGQACDKTGTLHSMAKCDELAFYFFTQASNAQIAFADTYLGIMYQIGRGTKQDQYKAAQYYDKAAKAGSIPSLFNLGLMYYQGVVIARDFKRALENFASAAEKGLPLAMFNLAFMYLKGEGCDKNRQVALQWFQKAEPLLKAQGQQEIAYVCRDKIDNMAHELSMEALVEKVENIEQNVAAKYKQGQFKLVLEVADAGKAEINKLPLASIPSEYMIEIKKHYASMLYWKGMAMYCVDKASAGAAINILMDSAHMYDNAKTQYGIALVYYGMKRYTQCNIFLEKAKRTQGSAYISKEIELLKKQVNNQASIKNEASTQVFNAYNTMEQCNDNMQKLAVAPPIVEVQATSTYSTMLEEYRNKTNDVPAPAEDKTQVMMQQFAMMQQQMLFMQQELVKCKQQAQATEELKEQVNNMEKGHKLLMKDYQEKQFNIEQEQYIKSVPELWAFYVRIQKKLIELFLACKVLQTGLIQKAATNTNQVCGAVGAIAGSPIITLAGTAIDLVAPGAGTAVSICSKLVSLTAKGIDMIHNQQEQVQLKNVADMAHNSQAMDMLAQGVARKLCFIYEPQLRVLTIGSAYKNKLSKAVAYLQLCSSNSDGGSEMLADCAVARMLEAMRAGRIDHSHDMVDQLVASVLLSKVKQGCVPFITDKNIETKDAKLHKGWTDAGVFQQTGVRTKQGNLYRAQNTIWTDSNKYGFRISSEHEIKIMRSKIGITITMDSNIKQDYPWAFDKSMLWRAEQDKLVDMNEQDDDADSLEGALSANLTFAAAVQENGKEDKKKCAIQ